MIIRYSFNKPVYMGATTLELNKGLMQTFHCNYIKNKNGTEAEMLLIDSDSLIYIIEIENAYKNFHKDAVLSELISYPKDPKYYDLNKLIVFKMKDETRGVPINGFIGSKSKMYTFTKEDNNECKKSEGINKVLLLMN